jgi:hypothetical protein
MLTTTSTLSINGTKRDGKAIKTGLREIEILAVIGGKTEAVKRFAAEIKLADIPDDDEILGDFSIGEIEKDFSIFSVYFDRIRWAEEHETTWVHLCEMARKAGLDCLLYRPEEDKDDSGFCSIPDKISSLYSIRRVLAWMLSDGWVG